MPKSLLSQTFDEWLLEQITQTNTERDEHREKAHAATNDTDRVFHLNQHDKADAVMNAYQIALNEYRRSLRRIF